MTRLIAPRLNLKTIIIFLLIIFAPLTICVAQQDLKLNASAAQIDPIFADWNSPDKAGIAIGIIRNGQIVYKKGYGSANLEHKIPVTTSTKFHVGPLADQFIAFAILLLQQEGKLSIQDDVRNYLPEIPDFGQTIRISHLLCHTSGLNELTVLKQIAGWHQADVFTKENAFDLIASQTELLATPGKLHQFNPTGMMLLEEIVARVSGKTYTGFVKENIFDPLKMSNSVFITGGNEILEQRATGYQLVGNTHRKIKLNTSADLPSSLYTTIDDLCLWMLNFRNPKIGSKALFEQLEAPAMVNGEAVAPVNSALKFGQHRMWDFKGTNKLYIIGMADGFACKLIRFPDLDFSAVVLGNEAAYNGYTTSNVADLYLEKYYKTNAAEPEAAPNYIQLSKDKLMACEGNYWNEEAFYSRKIYLKNDTLRYLREESGFESVLLPLGENRFRIPSWAKIIVEFEKHGDTRQMKVKVNEEPTNYATFYQADADWSKDLNAFTGAFYCAALDCKYTLTVKGNQLIASNQRQDDIELKAILENRFVGDKYHFKTIEFERDSNQTIKGFWLSSPGIAKHWFRFVPTKNIERVK